MKPLTTTRSAEPLSPSGIQAQIYSEYTHRSL